MHEAEAFGQQTVGRRERVVLRQPVNLGGRAVMKNISVVENLVAFVKDNTGRENLAFVIRCDQEILLYKRGKLELTLGLKEIPQGRDEHSGRYQPLLTIDDEQLRGLGIVYYDGAKKIFRCLY